MKVLISGSFWHGSLEESYARAFEANGWNVERFDWDKRAHEHRLGGTVVTERMLRNKTANEIGKEFVEVLATVLPDLIFVIKGNTIGRKTLESARHTLPDCLFINFNPDSPWDHPNRSSRFLESIPYYDAHFIWNRQLSEKFMAAGATRAEYLPFAYDPILHYPIGSVITERLADAVFVGTYSKERDRLLGSLEGLDIQIVGNGWDRAKRVPKKWIASDALYGTDALRVLANGACAINILRPQNEGSHNMRTFEIPAAARPMLTTRSSEQAEWLLEGKEMECYDTPEELFLKIKQLAEDHDYAESLARNGNERLKSETYEKRARQIVEVLGFSGGGGA